LSALNLRDENQRLIEEFEKKYTNLRSDINENLQAETCTVYFLNWCKKPGTIRMIPSRKTR
jgi:ABC-type Fe3+-hydroxamate transport system substrate-binding protein